jgi:hypothetical protein
MCGRRTKKLRAALDVLLADNGARGQDRLSSSPFYRLEWKRYKKAMKHSGFKVPR